MRGGMAMMGRLDNPSGAAARTIRLMTSLPCVTAR
jgi:hypothetical protein